MNATLAEIIPPLTPAQKSELVTHDTAIRKASTTLRVSRCLIAYHGWRLRKSGRWDELGYANEESYREAVGVPPGTWDVCMVVGQLLEALPFEEMLKIGVDKGKLLAGVHADIWFDFPWLEDAKRMTEADFRQIVVMRNRTLDNGESSQALLTAEAEYADSVTRAKIDRLRKKYNLDNSADAIKIALRDADTTVAIELAKAARHANKLLTLSKQALRQRRRSSLSGTDKNIERLITKAQNRLSDAITCAVTIQSKTD